MGSTVTLGNSITRPSLSAPSNATSFAAQDLAHVAARTEHEHVEDRGAGVAFSDPPSEPRAAAPRPAAAPTGRSRGSAPVLYGGVLEHPDASLGVLPDDDG